MSDDLVKRLREDQPVTQDMASTMQCALQDAAADRIEELEAELILMKTSGIVEVAVRNPSVMEYMKHWEGRAETAEAKLAKHEALMQAGFAEYERRLAEAEQAGYANAMEAERKLHEGRIEAAVKRALEGAASVAKNACLVPPDGGAPTENEEAVCRAAAEHIRALDPAQFIEGGKQ